MNPAISIVMPCFNVATHIAQSINCVLRQTFLDWELIVVDDGSSDDTLAKLKAYPDPRLRIHTQINQGVSSARNSGLQLAHGQYIAFLDADDSWEPTFLMTLFTALQTHPNAVLAYCGWKNVGLSGPRGEPFIPPNYETAAKQEDLFSNCRWPIHAALTKREAIMAAGGFNLNLKNAEDFALWLEVATTAPIVRVPEVLAYYHFHSETQASSNRTSAALGLLKAQKSYLDHHPDFAAQLGPVLCRKLLYGNLLKQGYENYWKRNLPTARIIFRHVMRYGYGHPKDWIYMLPALMPLPIHKYLIRILDKNNEPDSSSRKTTNQP